MLAAFLKALCLAAFVALFLFAAAASSQPKSPNAKLISKPSLISLHAEDEPIRHLLLRIGAQSRLSIIVNANVSGRASVVLDNVTADEALTAVLKPLGYTYEREGKIVVVVERGRLTQPSVSPTPSLMPTVLNATIISADRAAAILQQLYPHASIRVDHAANAIIAIATPDEIQGMRTVLQGVDIKNPGSVTVEAVQVHIANPTDVVAKLKPLYPNARIAVGPNKAILIAATPQDMTPIKSIIGSIDTPT